MADTDSNCRSRFSTSGTLTNIINSDFRAIQEQVVQPCSLSLTNLGFVLHSTFNVFAISVDLGNIVSTSEPVVWGIGMTRDPAVAYTAADGTGELRSPYWRSQFDNVQDAVSLIFVSRLTYQLLKH